MKPADLVAMAKVAKDYGVLVEHEFEGAVLRVQPVTNASSDESTGRTDMDGPCDASEPIRPPLDYREMFTMKTLAEIGVGQKAYSSLIRWCDLRTVKKLAARGYILAKPPGRTISDDEIKLTKDGLLAWTALLEHRKVRDGYPIEFCFQSS